MKKLFLLIITPVVVSEFPLSNQSLVKSLDSSSTRAMISHTSVAPTRSSQSTQPFRGKGTFSRTVNAEGRIEIRIDGQLANSHPSLTKIPAAAAAETNIQQLIPEDFEEETEMLS